jgi:chromosome segregation protein
MELKKIKLHGFKSFDKPTEFDILDGLTGIVGPNGCGKSNVLDSLQWVMGETSYKSLRGSEMDDVIFSGTDTTPSRNFAEVSVVMNSKSNSSVNSKDEGEEFEIRRRIERNSGSKYYINSIEKRAKDVQLFFADHSLGPHSVSIVKQGQINQIIESKPNERRKIIEEAAGVSGLHHRKHEAQLRLNATKTNIDRISDILNEIGSQLNSLKRQSSQAERFKSIASRIRQYERELIQLEWYDLETKERVYVDDISNIQKKLNNNTDEINKYSKKVDNIIEIIKPIQINLKNLQEELQLKNGNELNLKNELQYTIERIKNNKNQIEQIKYDSDREAKNSADQLEQLDYLKIKKSEILKNIEDIRKVEENVIQASNAATKNYKELEGDYNNCLSEIVQKKTERTNLENLILKNNNDLQNYNTEKKIIIENLKDSEGIKNLGQKKNILIIAQKKLDREVNQILEDIEKCQGNIELLSKAESEIQNKKIDVEINIKQLINSKDHIEDYLNNSNKKNTLIDKIQIKKGHEEKIALMLSDLEDSSLDKNDRKYWIYGVNEFHEEFSPEIYSLFELIKGPKEIFNYLKYTGYTDKEDLNEIIPLLKPGQLVLTANGFLVRWDGLITKLKPEDTENNILLAKKKLSENLSLINDKTIYLESIKKDYNHTVINLKQERVMESDLRKNWQNLVEEKKIISEDVYNIEKDTLSKTEALISLRSRLESLDENIKICTKDIDEHDKKISNINNIDKLETGLEKIKLDFYNAKTIADIKETNSQNLMREKRELDKNHNDTVKEEDSWKNRNIISIKHIDELNNRLDQCQITMNDLEILPEKINKKQIELQNEINKLNDRQNQINRDLSQLEVELSNNTSHVKSYENKSIKANEQLIQLKVQKENLDEKKLNLKDKIKINLGINPDNILDDFKSEILDKNKIIEMLSQAYKKREQIGAVNLTAEDEYNEIKVRFEDLNKEKDDLIAATETLQKGIVEIDKEARTRLRDSFQKVNNNFKLLFEKLFNGGKAELKINDEEDILESGLEIIAWPPGKKPQTISLLSGGEQALTVIALIIAVFLENPSPICILDEVDAPFDDNNIKKFCDLLNELSLNSKTKFLIVTHHPYTMSCMDRLYGVTMAKKGESVILSVDLNEAENMIEV